MIEWDGKDTVSIFVQITTIVSNWNYKFVKLNQCNPYPVDYASGVYIFEASKDLID